MSDSVLAWHFTNGSLRDGRPLPAIGEWLVHEGPITICKTGLHASELLKDALEYAPGSMLHRVTVRRIADRQDDKLVAHERRIEWTIDADPVLRSFSRRVALDVATLWDMPNVVRRFLETGDESAWDVARDAARDVARAAARAAAWDVATSLAMDAARAAAWAAARAAATSKYNDWLVEMVEAAR
jgi:hypothetical protein